MQLNRSNVAFALFALLPLAACRSHERHDDVRSASVKEYRSCCAMECDTSCTNDCCEKYFDSKGCDASCTQACCKK